MALGHMDLFATVRIYWSSVVFKIYWNTSVELITSCTQSSVSAFIPYAVHQSMHNLIQFMVPSLQAPREPLQLHLTKCKIWFFSLVCAIFFVVLSLSLSWNTNCYMMDVLLFWSYWLFWIIIKQVHAGYRRDLLLSITRMFTLVWFAVLEVNSFTKMPWNKQATSTCVCRLNGSRDFPSLILTPV